MEKRQMQLNVVRALNRQEMKKIKGGGFPYVWLCRGYTVSDPNCYTTAIRCVTNCDGDCYRVTPNPCA